MIQPTLTIYGADWCPDCRRSKQFLFNQNIPFTWIDVDQDENASDLVKRMNNGNRIIPTIIFEDGSFLAEPSDRALADKLGIPA